MATKTANAGKKEFKLEQVFAMWKRVGKGGKAYFTGQHDGKHIIGFFNTAKQNPKEPDIRIYHENEKGDIEKEPFVSLWCNVKDNNKKYLSGKIDGKRVVGFINAKATDENKQPYFSVYWSDNAEETNNKTKGKKAEQKEQVQIDDDLPF